MKQNKQTTGPISVKLKLLPSKQRAVLGMLHQHSSLGMAEIATLLEMPKQHVMEVLSGKNYFNKNEAKKLAEYFCILCGE